MKKIYLLCCFFLPLLAIGQQGDDKQDFFQKLSGANIGLRKSYAGSSSQEQKPASFFFSSDIKNNSNFFTADLGLKVSELDVFQNTSFNDKVSLVLFPKLEYHRNTEEENQKDTFSAGVNMEFFPVPYKTPIADGWEIAPWIQSSVDIKNDKVNDLSTMNYSSYLSIFSSRAFLPGGKARAKDGSLVFRYFAYSGYELYSEFEEVKGKSSYWSSRIFMELWPIPAKTKEYIQLTFEYNHRKSLKDSLYRSGNLNWATVGLNIYPTGKANIGLGFEYSKGGDPNNSFLDTERILLGLNVKI